MSWLKWLGVAMIASEVAWWRCCSRNCAARGSPTTTARCCSISGTGRRSPVPVELVEAFFIGQGPLMLPGAPQHDVERESGGPHFAARSELCRARSEAGARRWCDSYVTIRGTWCEPLNGELVRRLNRRLREVYRRAGELNNGRKLIGVATCCYAITSISIPIGRGLLVSVRNADEARIALAGGADVIDVKEPIADRWGRPTRTVADVVAAVGERAPISMAVGELLEGRHQRDLNAGHRVRQDRSRRLPGRNRLAPTLADVDRRLPRQLGPSPSSMPIGISRLLRRPMQVLAEAMAVGCPAISDRHLGQIRRHVVRSLAGRKKLRNSAATCA